LRPARRTIEVLQRPREAALGGKNFFLVASPLPLDSRYFKDLRGQPNLVDDPLFTISRLRLAEKRAHTLRLPLAAAQNLDA